MSDKKIIGEEERPGLRLLSYLFTGLTLMASVVTIAPVMSHAFVVSPVQTFAPAVKSESCRLVSTNYSAKVTGYTARVTVKQVFHNPNNHPFDAVYTFPLSDSAAVDEMTMKIGSRVVRAELKKKAEARAVFAAAQAQGKTASLLEQKRTNVFEQSVANVDPREAIEVTLKYTDTLAFAKGRYSLVVPTRVGPRFSPSTFYDDVGGDAKYEGAIAFDVDIDGGMPISNVQSNRSSSLIDRLSVGKAHLLDKSATTGDDFIVSWDVSVNAIESGVVTHRDGTDGYLTAMIVPPKRVTRDEAAPKEMIFLIDCSGSQTGEPLRKAKETLHFIVEHMNRNDTFQMIAFNNSCAEFSPEPQSASSKMKSRAHGWIDALTADGGTVMAPAIERVCSKPAAANRLRIVSFMTDGFVSNDYEIINLVKRLRGTSRWFPFGTGQGVNRTLIDGIAKEGGGEAEYVALDADGNTVAAEFYERISSPVLTDVHIHFEGINVDEVYPCAASDVWAEKPLYFHARFHGWGSGAAVITGFAGGTPYKKRIPLSLPAFNSGNEAVAQMWARAKVDDLMSKDLIGAQNGRPDPKIENNITEVAQKHHLATQYTSFVAVANPVGAFLRPTFNTVVSQLNALNCYSAVTPSVATLPVEEPAPRYEFPALQYAGLAVMWIACLLLSRSVWTGSYSRRREQSK